MSVSLRRISAAIFAVFPLLLPLVPSAGSSLAAAPLPRSTGLLPGEFGVPFNLSSALPACGQCHSPAPNANGAVTVQVSAAARVLALGATINGEVHVAGGPGLGLSGFVLETDVGTLQAGATTRTATGGGPAITHVDRFNDRWPFQFQAPTAAGLVRWTAVGQAVNANFNVAGDSFGFYGPDSNVPGVAFRLFVNSANVVAVGQGCAGSDDHVPLLGARADARVGQTFRTELHGAPPGHVALAAFGLSSTAWNGVPLPIDLSVLGAPGCALLIDQVLTVVGVTSGSGSGGGAVTFAWPVPPMPRLAGASLFFQALVVDAVNPLGITATNALRAVVQR